MKWIWLIGAIFFGALYLLMITGILPATDGEISRMQIWFVASVFIGMLYENKEGKKK